MLGRIYNSHYSVNETMKEGESSENKIYWSVGGIMYNVMLAREITNKYVTFSH